MVPNPTKMKAAHDFPVLISMLEVSLFFIRFTTTFGYAWICNNCAPTPNIDLQYCAILLVNGQPWSSSYAKGLVISPHVHAYLYFLPEFRAAHGCEL